MSTPIVEHRAPTGYLSEAEAAAIILVHKNTLARWRRSGYGPQYHRIGRGRNAKIRYRAADVDAWMRANAADENPADAVRGVA